MHLLLAFISIIAVWIRKDYRAWKTYYSTMQYVALGNLTYNFLCASHWLWQLSPDIKWFNHSLLEMSYTFIVFPFTALMFLSHYPEEKSKWKVLLHYLCWIGIYVGVEYILMIRGSIIYKYGWSLGWSALFDCIMFPFLRLHYKKPLFTLIASVPMTIFWVWFFDIPVSVPIPKR
ncbi:CBO0543 family protein [Bacillus sp. 31A1R]|uniref:CBO0543 family protein n=1 Tax=Robertmurraya mangrovi TaxID=3098077 RepID=A0ABU5IWI5_9BACI|nr:CBO0543 family protein [Bacillus sp. 31A1R]MDZ5471491.1 CBO0543 family protein [Bacillus sp. 31A1R]